MKHRGSFGIRILPYFLLPFCVVACVAETGAEVDKARKKPSSCRKKKSPSYHVSLWGAAPNSPLSAFTAYYLARQELVTSLHIVDLRSEEELNAHAARKFQELVTVKCPRIVTDALLGGARHRPSDTFERQCVEGLSLAYNAATVRGVFKEAMGDFWGQEDRAFWHLGNMPEHFEASTQQPILDLTRIVIDPRKGQGFGGGGHGTEIRYFLSTDALADARSLHALSGRGTNHKKPALKAWVLVVAPNPEWLDRGDSRGRTVGGSLPQQDGEKLSAAILALPPGTRVTVISEDSLQALLEVLREARQDPSIHGSDGTALSVNYRSLRVPIYSDFFRNVETTFDDEKVIITGSQIRRGNAKPELAQHANLAVLDLIVKHE